MQKPSVVLSNYHKEEYSVGFQHIMSQALAKIQKNQNNLKLILNNSVSYSENISQRNKTTKLQQIIPISQRKKMFNVNKYYYSPKMSLNNINTIEKKRWVPIRILCKKESIAVNDKVPTQSQNKALYNLGLNFYKKIDAFNQSLISRTYISSDLCSDTVDTNPQSLAIMPKNIAQSKQSKIKKNQNTKKYANIIRFRNIMKIPKSQSLTNQIKALFQPQPWQTDNNEDINYLSH